MSLLHDDNHSYFDMEKLEGAARSMLEDRSLIRRAREGDREAATARRRWG